MSTSYLYQIGNGNISYFDVLHLRHDAVFLFPY